MLKTKVRCVWEQRVTDYKSSEQTAKMWCESNNLRPATLRYWIREFKANNTIAEKVTSWISVDTTKLRTIPKEQPIVVKIGAAAIEINSDFNKDLFSKVSEVLFSLC